MTEVQLRSVAKRFGDEVAIEALDLRIPDGELVALLGPSGCGKTTTLRMISGLETPSAGQILFEGRDVSGVSVQERNVGMVFQRYALFPHMTVEKNVAFGLSIRGLPKSEIAERVAEILGVVQLSEYRKRFPSQLSGGQMQRVAIARTLITEPDVLMMDEPLANLDTGLRGEMRRFIRELQQRLGITTIFVTHDQVEAMELADRVAVIFDGRLAQYGAPDRLYRKPASLNVARFLGATNLVPGRLRDPDLVDTPLGTLVCPWRQGQTGDAVHVMARSELIDIGTERTAPTDIEGRIIAREFFGATVSYSVACQNTHVNVTEQARRMLELGAPVWLKLAPEHMWIIPE
ncbi:ABC transporter ATP-binding protein [Palleronia caenipelagi]|uniref:ABC transporter ATP-binding protein n=1 Tax=Palleronia caenipelagi TaxID=2489174 RepID=A0A547Q6I7_9RHOB|nr:ABC transporter ATP-binding protein [Palleronia caenipelagi]TRD21990.1 ABC transporter ATP-binding protein [Palleronia caenipelagi]